MDYLDGKNSDLRSSFIYFSFFPRRKWLPNIRKLSQGKLSHSPPASASAANSHSNNSSSDSSAATRTAGIHKQTSRNKFKVGRENVVFAGILKKGNWLVFFLCFASRSVVRSELGKVALITGHISEGKERGVGCVRAPISRRRRRLQI